MSRVAVVTGAASGIGLGVARQLASDGHHLALLDRDGAAVEAEAARLQTEKTRALAVEVDVSDRNGVDAAFARVRAELGPVEILVTSAGIESFDPVLDITPEKWDRILAVNLTGTFSCIQCSVPDMLSAGWGRIVTISSSSAQSGAPNMAHYASSKGGVIALTKALGKELATSGVLVNAIAPAVIETPMNANNTPEVLAYMLSRIPMGRIGQADEVAALVAWLVSDAVSFSTGAVYDISGGRATY